MWLDFISADQSEGFFFSPQFFFLFFLHYISWNLIMITMENKGSKPSEVFFFPPSCTDYHTPGILASIQTTDIWTGAWYELLTLFFMQMSLSYRWFACCLPATHWFHSVYIFGIFLFLILVLRRNSVKKWMKSVSVRTNGWLILMGLKNENFMLIEDQNMFAIKVHVF